MEHKSEFDKSYGRENVGNKKIYKVKMQCNGCGHIGYELRCPNNDGTMHKYKNPLSGIKFK